MAGAKDKLGSSKPSKAASANTALAAAPSGSSSAATSAASTPEPSSSALPDPKTDLPAYLLKLQSALQPLTRHAAAIPSHGDLAFHRSMDRKLAKKLDTESDRILQSISQLSGWIASDSRAPKIPLAKGSGTSSTKKAKGSVEMDLDLADVTTNESFASNLGELVDHLLESADTCLDEYTGKLAPRKVAAANDENAASATGEQGAGARMQAMTAVQNGKALPKTGNLPSWVLNAPIPPPQKNFTIKADNSADTLWQPRLKLGKPNAKVPLGHINPPRMGADGNPLPRGPRRGMYCAEGDPLDNPYYHEISHSEPPTHALSKPDPSQKDNPPPPLNEKEPSLSTDACPFQWVSTKQQIEQLRDHLDEDRVQEIAIDLEHHSYRTYQGIVCLMQLSTRWGDWIIDTISDEVRQHAEMLNSSFTNPAKVKVLHGANHDVLWLQRDLGLYLVNLFDTYHATNVLLFPSHGLNYLMARYCNFDADKRYQLADWRIRPLPKEMLYYARSDTHTLLYIYDNLRHELMEAGGVNGIREVFERSKDVAMATYAKEEWDSEGETREGWRSVWRKWGGEAALGTEDRQELSEMKKEERLVRALHQWRDGVAREEDESPRYILGASNLMMLATRAPTTKEGVLACIPPNATGLKKRVEELVKLTQAEASAWEKDQEKRTEEKKQKLSQALLNGSQDNEMDVGESVARGTPTVAAKKHPEPTSATQTSISAISQAAGAQPAVDASVWSDTSAAPATAASRLTLGGAVRSFASNLFGQSKAPAAPKSTLSSTSSKLFGTSATGNRTNKAAAKLDAVKAGFISQVGSLFGSTAPSHGFDDADDVPMQQESTTSTPMPAEPVAVDDAATAPASAEHVEEDDDASEKEDYIVVSTAFKSKPKKPKSTAQGHSTPQDESMPSKKELKKKRKAEARTDAVAPQPKKRKEKFDGEFDFSATGDAFQSPAPKKEDRPKGGDKKKQQQGKDHGKKGGDKIDEAIFRQPRDRARRKHG
ncbi:HRDC domain protein [Kalmanozyma brasiliensis GHG001]|uniref:HRDC domain protein n=1 Tax=Kalmanozyma brasiliensis (strain GHG001) TaxID=1365824 RepID=UPI001CE78246|nr:HRDC domain protein [Kalmanozyma brasiliensis GHG001]EST07416.2 HRDC domain protein [Kalmanozyma brasiliensis GHG001]